MSQDVPECPRMSQNVPEYPRMSLDVPGYPRMSQDVQRCPSLTRCPILSHRIGCNDWFKEHSYAQDLWSHALLVSKLLLPVDRCFHDAFSGWAPAFPIQITIIITRKYRT